MHIRPVLLSEGGAFALGAGRTEAAAYSEGALPFARRSLEGPSSQVDLPLSRPLCGRAALAPLLRCGPRMAGVGVGKKRSVFAAGKWKSSWAVQVSGHRLRHPALPSCLPPSPPAACMLYS